MITRESIQSLAEEIASKFDVERIILFGSYAYGTPTADSDVDLLVMMDFAAGTADQALAISCAVSHHFPRDILVCTPTEAATRYELFEPIIRHAVVNVEVLFERGRQKVAG